MAATHSKRMLDCVDQLVIDKGMKNPRYSSVQFVHSHQDGSMTGNVKINRNTIKHAVFNKRLKAWEIQ